LPVVIAIADILAAILLPAWAGRGGSAIDSQAAPFEKHGVGTGRCGLAGISAVAESVSGYWPIDAEQTVVDLGDRPG